MQITNQFAPYLDANKHILGIFPPSSLQNCWAGIWWEAECGYDPSPSLLNITYKYLSDETQPTTLSMTS